MCSLRVLSYFIVLFSSYHAGLARLRGLLCVGSTAEEDIVSKYGDLAAEVFWLMGKLNK